MIKKLGLLVGLMFISALVFGSWQQSAQASHVPPTNRARQICYAQDIFETSSTWGFCVDQADQDMDGICTAIGQSPGTSAFNECKVEVGGFIINCIDSGGGYGFCVSDAQEQFVGTPGAPDTGSDGSDGCPVGATYCNPQNFGSSQNTLNTQGVDVRSNPIYTRLVQIINFLSVGVGIVITGSVVYAGIQYITSRGDPNKTSHAVNRIWQAGIALFLFIFGWALLNWLIPGGVLNPVNSGVIGLYL